MDCRSSGLILRSRGAGVSLGVVVFTPDGLSCDARQSRMLITDPGIPVVL